MISVCRIGIVSGVVLVIGAAAFMRSENKGRYYHDGCFATLGDVVNHYNKLMSLGLSDQEKSDLVEYLKSLPSEN
jgi:hypothetical protein